MASSPTQGDAPLPDFIIGGGMKSATSTLHHLLAQNEEGIIKDVETHFSSVDAVTEHPGVLHEYPGKWAVQGYHRSSTQRTKLQLNEAGERAH